MTLGKLLVVGVVATALTVPVTANLAHGSASTGPPKVSSRFLLDKLNVGPTYHAGYVRSKFELWTSHPDGCDTREKVLLRDAVVRPKIGAGCYLTGGKWRSPYDGLVIRSSTDVQIDHVVPLGAAWGDGAWRWTPATRRDFANDLGTRYDLLAVSASTNESKSDQAPNDWLPPRRSFDCRYMADYTAVLWRWRLNVSPTQKTFLKHQLRQCGWPKILAPSRPAIGKRPTGGGGGGRKGQIATGIKVGAIQFDSPGDDTGSNASLNGEWVKVVNTSSKRASLGDWSLHDSVDHLYVFPAFHLGAHHSVKVHTGSGHDNASNLFWDQTEYIWNNTGDTATLLAPNGKLADRCAYTSSGTTTRTNC